MSSPPDWQGRRYYPISQFYKRLFGERVHKIPLSVARSCPHRNRDNSGGCVFCDQWGAAGSLDTAHLPFEQQIELNRRRLARRSPAKKYLLYFQAFTNTYDRLSAVKTHLDTALQEPGICGIIIGTRPDCLPEPVTDLLAATAEHIFLSVEIGVQSFFDAHLAFLNRGHTAAQSIEAIQTLGRQKNIHTGIHLIFGLPGETESEIIKTAEIINQLPVDSVKLHQLHVLKATRLADLFHRGLFDPLALEAYGHRIVRFLEHLSPYVPVHRLAAYVGHPEQLVAPAWTGDRLGPSRFIESLLEQKGTWQGRREPSAATTDDRQE